jgi:hypothetical protein
MGIGEAPPALLASQRHIDLGRRRRPLGKVLHLLCGRMVFIQTGLGLNPGR